MEYNATELQNLASFKGRLIEGIIIFLICLSGLIGNGIVIYLLGFHIKRNILTTYILNLSIADFGVLIMEAIRNIYMILDVFFFMNYLYSVHNYLFLFIFMTSQSLLIVIGIDRCVCFFFPLWYQFHHPPRLSTAVCAVIWILNFLISVTHIILNITINYFGISRLQFYLNTVIFMPIMCVSTVAMLIKICLRSQRKKCGKPLRAILLVLVFFFFFFYPFNIIFFTSIFQKVHYYFFAYARVCPSLNSTINPIIYYLVGRDKMGGSNERIDKVLEELFEEDEFCREEEETTENLPL